ncbi:MAG: nicotinamide-nucleotide amidohydrolase family protein [Chlamydiales bacterium]|nr:nicotinamide-nucleotide amidohydrolase family protein [Chlamydiales bacterium]
MQVEILTIGSELLSGHTVNRNAAFLSRQLSLLGYVVSRHTVVPDDVSLIQKAYREASERVSLMIVTGGLGPTIDDVTRQALEPLFEKKSLLPNSMGTASGVFCEGPTSLLLLPGPPREMEKMFIDKVSALLQTKFPPLKPYCRLGCYLCLLREVEVNPFLEEMRQNNADVDIGIYPSQGLLFIEFCGSFEEKLREMAERLRSRFPTFYLGPLAIAPTVHQICIEQKKTMGLAESCSGGAIASAITAMPGASSYFLGSLVLYSNAWKERFLQISRSTLVEAGAVSFNIVEEMIQGIFRETDADIAMAVSGLLGPCGGSKEKPVGTVYIGIAQRGEASDIGLLRAPLDRTTGIQWVVNTALGALWRRLVHGAMTFS